MKAVLRQLISDFVGEDIPNPYPRDIHFPELPPKVKKGFVFIGMRRTGKTWTMYQEMHRLLNTGVGKQQLVYLNFEDDRLSQFKTEDWQYLLPAYIEAYPDQAKPISYIFLDEVHVAPDWEKFALRLIEHENVTLYLSGSSTKMLNNVFGTRLRGGRTLVREIFPMSFKEVLIAKEISFAAPFSVNQRATLQGYLDKYLREGGFPQAMDVEPILRATLIQNEINSVIYRDVVERHEITNIVAVKQFIIHALKNSASLLSINKMYNAFKSLGINVGKNALYEYALFFEDAYCLFFVKAFEFSLREQSTKPVKVYPIDPAVIWPIPLSLLLNKPVLLRPQFFYIYVGNMKKFFITQPLLAKK